MSDPHEPLVGRGRSTGSPKPGDDGTSAAEATEATAAAEETAATASAASAAARAIPRPGLEPAGRLAAAWTPARLRLGLGVGLVAVLAVAWIAFSSGGTPIVAPAPTTIPTASSRVGADTTTSAPAAPPARVAVPGWVPRAIASTCRARTGKAPSERVVVDCTPARGVATLRYRALASPAALASAYDGRRPTRRGGAGPSRCASGRNDERAWSDARTPATSAGRYRCTRPHGTARIEWTDDALHVLAVATRADGDLRSLYTWWTTVPGPVEATPAR